jgi:hypothetical protein
MERRLDREVAGLWARQVFGQAVGIDLAIDPPNTVADGATSSDSARRESVLLAADVDYSKTAAASAVRITGTPSDRRRKSASLAFTGAPRVE